MEKPAQWQFGIGFTVALAGVGMSFAAGDDETKLIGGAVLGLLGLLLAVLSFRTTLATAFPIRWLRQQSRAPRSMAVVDRLRFHSEELIRIVEHECKGKGKDYADSLLKPWKHEVIEFLDANIKTDVVGDFADLATDVDSGQPWDHLQSSYKAHLDFLEQLRSKIEGGAYFHVKRQESPSGNLLPRVHSFIYQSRLKRN